MTFVPIVNQKNECINCLILTEKIKIYEKCLEDLLQLDKKIIHNHNTERPNDFSDLSDSIFIINKCTNLDEIKLKDRKSITEQDNLATYYETKKYTEKYTEKIGGIYNIVSYIINMSKWIFL